MDKCECGARLPTHLLGIMARYEHVCSCERAYIEEDGKFVPNGTQRNPVAEFDRAHPEFAVDREGETG